MLAHYSRGDGIHTFGGLPADSAAWHTFQSPWARDGFDDASSLDFGGLDKARKTAC